MIRPGKSTTFSLKQSQHAGMQFDKTRKSLQSSFERLFFKYNRPFHNDDELDIMTLEIVEDRGILRDSWPHTFGAEHGRTVGLPADEDGPIVEILDNTAGGPLRKRKKDGRRPVRQRTDVYSKILAPMPVNRSFLASSFRVACGCRHFLCFECVWTDNEAAYARISNGKGV